MKRSVTDSNGLGGPTLVRYASATLRAPYAAPVALYSPTGAGAREVGST
jgi:hypothetical protein